MNKAQQLAERLKRYIPNGDGYSGEFANDLAEVVEYLSQDEQEPVAWLITHHENQPVLTFNSSDWASERFVKTPLYAQPPKRQPLSDEYIERVILNWDDVDEDMDLVEFARVIEKAHGIGE